MAADEKAVDPVCGMKVTRATAKHVHAHDGVTYYFCAVGCRSAFEKDPAAYLTKEARC